MAYVIAQLSDVHVGGPHPGNGDRLSAAVEAIATMRPRPDLVLLTGDNTHDSTDEQWAELVERLAPLPMPWEAINGNHDPTIANTAGHRSRQAGPLRLVLLDSSDEVVTDDDARWLDVELAAHPDAPTVVAIHHPPFETGIWWMDCLGLDGAHRFEQVVRRHPQVLLVLSGHVHRPIHTAWGSCSLWVSPSTAVAVAPDLHPDCGPAETAEPPMFSLHVFTGDTFVSHLVPVGAAATRTELDDPAFVDRLRTLHAERAAR